MSITLLNENATTITIDISAALTTLGKTQSDITDIIFIVKELASDSDEAAKLTKTLGVGIVDNTTYYTVTIDDTDFVDLNIGVGIMYLGLTKYLELDAGEDDTLVVKPDVIRG